MKDISSPTRPIYEGVTVPFWDVVTLFAAGVIFGIAMSITFCMLVVIQ